MTKVTTKEFVMERRTFLKLSAAAAVAGRALDFDTASAAVCTTAESAAMASGAVLSTTPMDAGKDFLYWIDGPMNAGIPGYSGDLAVRARLACTMAMDHGQNNTYLESVTLVEVNGSAKTMLAQVNFGEAVTTVTRRAPYAVFENLSLETTKQYQILCVKRKDGMVSVYQHTITDPRASRFDFKHLASDTDSDISQNFYLPLMREIQTTGSYYFTSDATKKGFVTTPYGVTQSGHHCSARVLKVEPVTSTTAGDFKIEIDFMHGDSSTDAHYMRYFLVLDPVGRVLGAVRRSFADGITSKIEVRRGFFTPRSDATPGGFVEQYRSTNGNVPYYRMHKKDDTTDMFPALDADQRQRYVTNVNILDCPYVSIYTDDKYHAIARFTLRLR